MMHLIIQNNCGITKSLLIMLMSVYHRLYFHQAGLPYWKHILGQRIHTMPKRSSKKKAKESEANSDMEIRSQTPGRKQNSKIPRLSQELIPNLNGEKSIKWSDIKTSRTLVSRKWLYTKIYESHESLKLLRTRISFRAQILLGGFCPRKIPCQGFLLHLIQIT